MLPETILQVLMLRILLLHLEALLRRLFLVGEGINVHDTHVMNTVCPSLPEVAGQQISLLL